MEWDSTPASASIDTLVIVGCRQVASPGVHFSTPGLLQLTTPRDQRPPVPTLGPQAVQNTTACLITDTRRCEHITPVMQQLQWLPIRQRAQFKIAVLVYKALHHLLSAHLAEDCHGRRQLRSLHIDMYLIQRTNTVTTRLGDRSFAAAGPQVWNSLPAQLREAVHSDNVDEHSRRIYLVINSCSAE